jgi:hypothetical protein
MLAIAEGVMANWRMTGEPSLDELLGDEIMEQVTRTAGLDRSELRRRLADLARRLADRPCRDHSRSCGMGVG